MVCQKGLRPLWNPRTTDKSVATLNVCRYFFRLLSARRRQQNISPFCTRRHAANPDLLRLHIGSVVVDYWVDKTPITSYNNIAIGGERVSIVAERLKSLRHGVKLSQKELAEKIGITQSSINRHENNQSEASYQALLLYSDFFDVSMDYIFGRTDKPQGKLYEFRPKVIENNEEMRQFIEMCFDPNSPMNDRLKQVLADMLGEVK